MTHDTNKNLTRLHSLLLAFFGDETLHFHSTRLSNFFNAAFADAEFDDEEPETYTPNIPRLLHCQNNLQRLLDAAHLLHQHFPHRVTPYRSCVFKQLQHIYPLLKDWDDFPSHFHPHEWCNPETVLEEFFTFQSIDDWKNTVSGLLESALGERPLIATMSEKQLGFIVLLLHRLQDAVWLLHIIGRIPSPEAENIIMKQPTINTTMKTFPLNFFFMVSNGKFTRIDHHKIVCLVATDDHVQLHTLTDIHQPKIPVKEMKELLPEDKFVWLQNEAMPFS